jgi:hypothetical protein
MKLDNKLMIQILKEEYDKRIMSFLDEVETKAKYQKASKDDIPLIQSAKGLKVFDGAGNRFTVDSIKVINNKTYVVLNVPGEGDESLMTPKQDITLYDTPVDLEGSNISEKEVTKKPAKNKEQDNLRPLNKKADFKRQKLSKDVPSYQEINDGKQIIVDIETFERDFTL